MAHILHFASLKGSREYIVITELEDTAEIREEYCQPGFEFYQSYELDEAGTLPTEVALVQA